MVRFDERVIGQYAALAVLQELPVGSKKLRLVLQQIDHLQRRALGVEVVDLGGLAGRIEPLVDALELRIRVEHFHADVAERRAVVGKRPVA